MARPNNLQIILHSSSDSGNDEDIPAKRPEYVAESKDRRHEEHSDDDEANEAAEVLNGASLFGTQATLLSAASNSIRRSFGSLRGSILGNSKKQQNLDATEALPDHSMSTGVIQKPTRLESPTNTDGNRSKMYAGNERAFRSSPRRLKEDESKKSGHGNSKMAKTSDPPRYPSKELIPDATNENAHIQSSHRGKRADIEGDLRTPSGSSEHEEEQDVQQHNTELAETSPAKNTRTKSAVVEAHVTHRYPTRSMHANTEKRADISRSSERSGINTSEKSPQQPKDPSLGVHSVSMSKRGRGRPPKGPREPEPSANIPSPRVSDYQGSAGVHGFTPIKTTQQLPASEIQQPESIEDEETTNSTLEGKLNILSDIMDKLGCKRVLVNGTFVLDPVNKVDFDERYLTKSAKSISKIVDRLTEAYTGMSEMESAETLIVESFDEMHQHVIDLLRELGGKYRAMLAEKLGNYAEGGGNANYGPRTKMLHDIYIHVVPGLVKALKAAGNLGHEPSKIGTENLQEFLTLLNILYNIAERTRRQDKSVQPKVDGNISYPLSEPTRMLLPILKEIRQQCREKLTSHEDARRAEELRRKEPERRKRRDREAEEARLAEEEHRQRVEERKRAIFAQLEEQRRKLGLPPCTQPVPEPPSTQPRGGSMDDEDWLHDEHQADTERVIGIFGLNNIHPGTAPKEWSKSETNILIKGLRRERGPRRYGELAARLDRPLDEIVERAKYLKAQVEYTLKRLQEEDPDGDYPPVKPWIANIGSE